VEYSELEVDRKRLIDVLKRHPEGAEEGELFSLVWPEDRFPTGRELYRRHFILFHNLYSLAVELDRCEYQLVTELSKVYLLPAPGPEYCCELDAERRVFCARPARRGLCRAHRDLFNGLRAAGVLRRGGLPAFYLDLRNLDDHVFERMSLAQQGFLDYARRFDEVESARRLLGLPEDFSLSLLKKRFRSQALRLHPDAQRLREGSASPGSPETAGFRDLRAAYELLEAVRRLLG
jgi:hypothetical protein